MAIVIDASVAIAWRLRDREGTPYADSAIDRGGLGNIIVPDLFWHEVRNVLLGAERKGRIDAGTAEDHLKDLHQLSLQSDSDQDDGQIAALARRHGLSGYDAAYLETAIHRGAELTTLDKRLAAVASKEGVFLDGD